MNASGPKAASQANRYGMLGRSANLIKMSLGFGGQGKQKQDPKFDAYISLAKQSHKINLGLTVQQATSLAEAASVDG